MYGSAICLRSTWSATWKVKPLCLNEEIFLPNDDDVAQSQGKTVYNDDENILYENIMNGYTEINTFDEQGKTASGSFKVDPGDAIKSLF